MTKEAYVLLAVTVGSMFATIIAHVIARRKYDAEAAQGFAEADAKHTEAQHSVIDMLSKQVNRLQSHVEVMDEKIHLLQEENRDLRRSIVKLENERAEYQSKVNKYEKNQS